MKKYFLIMVLSVNFVACTKNAYQKAEAQVSKAPEDIVKSITVPDLTEFAKSNGMSYKCLNSEVLNPNFKAFYSNSSNNDYPLIAISGEGIANIEANASSSNYYQFGIDFNTTVKMNYLVERSCPIETGLESKSFTLIGNNLTSISYASVLVDVINNPTYQSCTFKLMYNWVPDDEMSPEVIQLKTYEDEIVDFFVGNNSCTNIVTVKFY